MTDPDSPASDVPLPFRRRSAAVPEPAEGPLPSPTPAAGAAYTVVLDAHFAAWLEARAAAHGQAPGEHAAALLRQFWASHDHWRHQDSAGATRPAGPR